MANWEFKIGTEKKPVIEIWKLAIEMIFGNMSIGEVS
jgi:hypothetical protein